MGGPTSFAALNAGFAVDLTNLDAFKMRLQELRKHFGPIFESVAPVFGAYMRYSAVLEFGWRDKRMANFRVQGGGTIASDSGVPHIYRAIRTNIGYITDGLMRAKVKPYVKKQLSGESKTSRIAESKELARVWGRLLNDKPRRDAVNRAPYRYGFHRRSIQGSAYPLRPDLIAKMRLEAKQGYEKAKWSDKAKALAKKRGGQVLKPVDL